MRLNESSTLPPVIRSIELQLSAPLPGWSAQQKMSPSDRRGNRKVSPHNIKTENAAVMILVYFQGDKLFTIFIRRNIYPGPHSGQISFPGGREEPHDQSLARTALRETAEETGLKPETIRILGSLTRLYIPVSGFMVHPFVGYYPNQPVFSPDPSEVQEIIPADLKKMAEIRPGNMVIPNRDQEIRAPFYHAGKHKVWGATAMITSEFLEILHRAGYCGTIFT